MDISGKAGEDCDDAGDNISFLRGQGEEEMYPLLCSMLRTSPELSH